MIVISALFIWYPELLPFLGLGWALYAMSVALASRARAIKIVALASVVGVLVLALMNSYFFSAVQFMLKQAGNAGITVASDAGPVNEMAGLTFPYFLLPSGLATFFGLTPLVGLGDHEWAQSINSAAFVISLIVSAWFLWGLPGALRRAMPVAGVFVVMFALAVTMAYGYKDFGLFKLAMYAQPFLLMLIADRIIRSGKSAVNASIAVLLIGTGLNSQRIYVAVSTGELLSGPSEIWHSSSAKINATFGQIIESHRKNAPYGFMSDSATAVEAQNQALYTKGISFITPSWLDMESPVEISQVKTFRFLDRSTLFRIVDGMKAATTDRWLITVPKFQTIFNLSSPNAKRDNYYQVFQPGEAQDHLIFIPSDAGRHYYFATPRLQPVSYSILSMTPCSLIDK